MALPLETVRSLDLIRLYEALGVGSHLVIPNRHDGIQFRVLLQTLARSQNLVKIGTVGGGLPTVYQGVFSAAREGLKVVPVFNMAQATLRRRSAIDRRARPWL
jgi:hypothetical protein